MLQFFDHARLAKPTAYDTGPEEWAHNLRLFGMVRNALIHGAQTVSDDLADVSAGSGMEFTAGQPLDVSVTHLQGFELFTSQLLTAFNMSLAERVR